MPRDCLAVPHIGDDNGKLQPPEHLFTGAYETTSPEYLVSRTHACIPPSYHRQVLLFHGIFDVKSPTPFNAGQLITVGIDPPGSRNGHSVYGFSYEVETSFSKGKGLGYYWQMEVEVHTIPEYEVEWQYAHPFPIPPIGSAFVQPHGFRETAFELLTPASPERWNIIKVDVGRSTRVFQPNHRFYQSCRPELRLPPREAYPQNKNHGPLIPARALLEAITYVEVPPPQPRRPALPPLLTHLFYHEARNLCDRSIEEAARRKRRFDEMTKEDITVPAPPPSSSPANPPPQFMQKFNSNMRHLRNWKIRSDEPSMDGYVDYVADEDLFGSERQMCRRLEE